jgi:hypothetical protein
MGLWCSVVWPVGRDEVLQQSSGVSPLVARLEPGEVELGTGGDEIVASAARELTQAPVVIVVYGFGSRQILSRLYHANVIALASPVDPAQIARICQLGLAIDPTPPAAFSQMLMHSAAARRYDDTFLHQLSQLPSKVQCECPNHMADLLNKLNAFERYSLECESTSIKDASMHAMLYSVSRYCRELLEEVLRRLLMHEGIPECKA